jgi:hypothetical protein
MRYLKEKIKELHYSTKITRGQHHEIIKTISWHKKQQSLITCLLQKYISI